MSECADLCGNSGIVGSGWAEGAVIFGSGTPRANSFRSEKLWSPIATATLTSASLNRSLSINSEFGSGLTVELL